MLIHYKKSHEKIAMGLLSFMFDKEDINDLQETLETYESNPNWHLYLWKDQEETIGVIGIRIENDSDLIIQHTSVNPSFRKTGIGRKMVNEICAIYKDKYKIYSNDSTHVFSQKCIPTS